MIRTPIMDDIEREINRTQTGRRKEVAYETLKHPKIPKTNIQPLKSIKKYPKTPTAGYLTRTYRRCKDNGHDLMLAIAIFLLLIVVTGAKILHWI
jgi:hypothetical protein